MSFTQRNQTPNLNLQKFMGDLQSASIYDLSEINKLLRYADGSVANLLNALYTFHVEVHKAILIPRKAKLIIDNITKAIVDYNSSLTDESPSNPNDPTIEIKKLAIQYCKKSIKHFFDNKNEKLEKNIKMLTPFSIELKQLIESNNASLKKSSN